MCYTVIVRSKFPYTVLRKEKANMPKMSSTTATIYWYCKTPDGWKRFPAVYGGNGRIRKGVVVQDGGEREYPEGRYQIRTYRNGKNHWQNVQGKAGGDAIAAQTQSVYVLRQGTKPAAVEATPAAALTVPQLAEKWLDELALKLKPKSMNNYRSVMKIFLKTCSKELPANIDANDYFRVVKAMREARNSESTIFSYATRLLTFFTYIGVPKSKFPDAKDKAKDYKPKPEAFSEEEILTLMNSAPVKRRYRRHAILRNATIYEFLWKTGAREQEAMTLEWHNIDFRKGVVTIRNKFRQDHRIKTSLERDIPLTPHLMETLKLWRDKNPGRRYVFGQLYKDKPLKNFLR
jgi:hypothetical protein